MNVLPKVQHYVIVMECTCKQIHTQIYVDTDEKVKLFNELREYEWHKATRIT